MSDAKKLTPEGYMPRLVENRLDALMDSFGCVEINGPKWCGKTWTARTRCTSMTKLDDPAEREAAELDPSLALMGGSLALRRLNPTSAKKFAIPEPAGSLDFPCVRWRCASLAKAMRKHRCVRFWMARRFVRLVRKRGLRMWRAGAVEADGRQISGCRMRRQRKRLRNISDPFWT